MATNNSINNTSNPISSTEITIDPGSSGDSYIQLNINGTGEFRIGVDDDAGDAFKISQGSALGTNDTFIMTSSGERTLPLQPSFEAIVPSTVTNVTGNNVEYKIAFSSESFDQGGNYDGSTTFTAPVTGVYNFHSTVAWNDLSSSFTQINIFIYVNSTISTAYATEPTTIRTGGFAAKNVSTVLNLTAADTVDIRTAVQSGTQVVDISLTVSAFGGYLVA